MQVVPVPLNVTTVRSQNDLKPTIRLCASLSKVSPLVVAYCFAAPGPMELNPESQPPVANYRSTTPRTRQLHLRS